MRLRTHLHVLTIGTLLPVAVFGLVATKLIADRERDLVRRGGQERTLALLTAVDAELDGSLKSLQALATSADLSTGNLASFHEEATRAVSIQPGWREIQLADPGGNVVLRTSDPYGASGSTVRELGSFRHAVESRIPTIRDLYEERDGAYRFGIRTPVIIADSVRYVVSALIDPAEIRGLLERQRLPSDWVGVVLDSSNRIVARTVDNEAMVGRLASVSLRSALVEAGEGWFRGRTLENFAVYTPFSRSPRTGWTVALGIPAGSVDAGAADVGWVFAAGIIAAVLAAILLANVLSRRIAGPIAALAATARAVGRGEAVEPGSRAGVREVREVNRVLTRAAEQVRQREATLRERESALRAADRAKDEFLAMLGHELRNPLSALMSAADVLEMSTPSDGGPTARAAGVIDRQVRHMTRLVDDLLDVSRVTTGKINLEMEALDLGAAVRSVVDTFQAAGRFGSHEIGVDVVPTWIRGDRSRIEQIAANLIGNAVKYTPAGGRVDIRVFERDGEAVFEVEDSGVGLTPELAPRVFDAFVQGDRSLDREAGGLGLGLTLVKTLVDRLGGTVTAYSAGPDRGARFTVRLPVMPPPERLSRADGAASAGHVETGERRRRRVLIIEDNQDARETLTTGLELLGHEVLAAADGEAGLALARSSKPDVAVIDIGLPRMNGFEVARRIRPAGSTPADTDAVRLVALTGYSQAETREHAEASGFDRSLTKPVGTEQLARVIEELLEESSPGA